MQHCLFYRYNKFFSKFAIVELHNKNLAEVDIARLKQQLTKTPTERFRLMINLFKLNQKLRKNNPLK